MDLLCGRVPTVYVENGDVVGRDPSDPIEVSYEQNFEGEPTAISNPEMLKMQWAHGHNNSIVNGIPRIGYMKGGKKARWKDEDMADYFVDKVKNFVTEHKDAPFFLYYGLHEPHVPRAGVNTMTVNKAYQILKNEGFIRTDRRLGAFVSESIADDTDFTEKLESELELLSAEACLTGMSREEFLSMCDKIYSQMKPCTA